MLVATMPIYEYYCRQCHGRFSHLARSFDEPAPPCPRCGNTDVERLITAAALVHSSRHHETALREAAEQVDGEDLAETARFLKESGRLEDADGLYGSAPYKELIARRIEGATDDDLADLVPDLVAQVPDTPVTQAAAATALSNSVERRMMAEGPPDDEEGEAQLAEGGDAPSPGASRGSRRSADDLGWG